MPDPARPRSAHSPSPMMSIPRGSPTLAHAGVSEAWLLTRRMLQGQSLGYVVRRTARALAAFDLAGQSALVRTLCGPTMRDFTRRHPRLLFKHLSPYLAGGFSAPTRLKIIHHHYARIAGLTDARWLVPLLDAQQALWQFQGNGSSVRITLGFPRETCFEGDLSLTLWLDDEALCQTSFSLARGEDVGLHRDNVLLVARMQGVADRRAEIRRATRLCLDIAPPYLLMMAAQAIGQALGADAIAGVSDAQQLQRALGNGTGMFFSYDQLWLSHGGRCNGHGIYDIPLPFAQRALTELRSGHRARNRRKRAFKAQLAETVGAAFGALTTSSPAGSAR